MNMKKPADLAVLLLPWTTTQPALQARPARKHAAFGNSVLLRILTLFGVLFTVPALAQIDVLDSVEVTHQAEQSEIRIHLNIPMRYKSHVPQRSGESLRIVVEPVATLGAEGDVLFGTENIQWSATDQVPLYEVVYESSGFSTATITLQFEREVEFELPPDPDFRSLVIVVKHPEKAATGPAQVKERDYHYAINLASSTEAMTAVALPALEELLAYRLYTTTFIKDGRTWNRLRLGFFTNKTEAAEVLRKLQSYFPGAWITPVSAEEIQQSEQGMPVAQEQRPAQAPVPSAPVVQKMPPAGSVSATETENIASLMEQAHGMMTDKDYDGAVRLYTKILQYPEHAHSQDAMEFLGLARERKGQTAQAKAIYEDYLQQYPEGEGAGRVQQRLAGLLTATKAPRGKLASVGDRGKRAADWDVFGGFSQFYRRDGNTSQLNDENQLTTVMQSSLTSDLDITGRLVNGDYDLRTRLTGGYLYDFLNDGEDNESTVSSLYFDARNRQRNLGMRLGRQSRSSGGVLGRFDGLLLELPLTSVLSVSATAGYPVNSSRDNFDDTRYFYGLNLELHGFARGWDANTFIIEQRADSLVDRRAVGGELRYFDVNRSFFTLVDYDLLYDELNTAQLLANWTATDKTTVNLMLDYRNSPILTTTNALQGQTVLTLEELLASYTEDEIYGIARDRTATSRLATLGMSHPITEKLQVSGDVTLSKLSSTTGSAGVAAVPGTDVEYFYNLQLIGSNLLKEGDITILGLRFIDATTSNTTSLSLNTRYPVSAELRVNPRFRADFRQNLMDGTEQFIYRPSARVTWNVRRRFRLEAELGGEWSDREIVTGSSKSQSYFINLGYRADF